MLLEELMSLVKQFGSKDESNKAPMEFSDPDAHKNKFGDPEAGYGDGFLGFKNLGLLLWEIFGPVVWIFMAAAGVGVITMVLVG